MEYPYIQYMYSYPHKLAYRTLYGVWLSDYVSRLSGAENSLYFHIPFCQYKCGYCNLFSLAGQSEAKMEEYVEAMRRHAAQLSEILPEDVSFSDLTFGGGTPFFLPKRLLKSVFSIAREYFGIEAGHQTIAAETSPNQTTAEKLRLFKEEGVNRISIGVQSFQETELLALYRFHTADTAKRALDLIKNTGFDCVNVDLIYGIPGQTSESLLDSLQQAVAFEPEELFVYPLYVKPGTRLFLEGVECAEHTSQMYETAREFLRKAGYTPYSMRRFVKQKSKEGSLELPVSLCGFGNTLSVGCGGRSYIGNLHFSMPYAAEQQQCRAILQNYIEQEDYLKITHGFLLSLEEERRRYVIRHILFGRGICRDDYRKHFGGEAEMDYPILLEWVKKGYAKMETEFISLTEKGIALSDFLGPKLISDEVKKRMEA